MRDELVREPSTPARRAEDVQLPGHCPECRMSCNHGLELEQVARARGVVRQCAWYEIGEDPHPMHLKYPHIGRLEQVPHARLVESPR
jgi:hypothetical protein